MLTNRFNDDPTPPPRWFKVALVLLLIATFVVLFRVLAFAVSAPQLYTGNYGQPGILSWPPSTTGNVAPTTNISGANTTFSGTSGVAIDASGNVWVGEYNNNKILKFNAGTTGNIAPVVTITPPAGSGHPRTLAFDSNGYLYVADPTAAGVYIYSPAQIASTGSPTPNLLVGLTTTLSAGISAVTIGSDNRIYTADSNPTISGGATTAAVSIFAASTAGGNVAPTAQITGTNTTFGPNNTDFVDGLAVDSTNNVYVVGSTLSKLFRFNSGHTGNVAPDGSITASMSTPHGVVVDSSGNIYVSQSVTNAITVYSSAGTLLQTISGGSTLINNPFELALWNMSAGEKGFFFAP